MDNEAIVMRKQMDETLAALTDKLGELERQVTGTVKTVQSSVTSVRDTFDVKLHVRQRPWTLLAGATALGLLGGFRLKGRRAASRPREGGNPEPQRFRSARLRESNGPSWMANVGEAFQPEIAELKGVVIGAALALARDLIVKQTSRPTEQAPHVTRDPPTEGERES